MEKERRPDIRPPTEREKFLQFVFLPHLFHFHDGFFSLFEFQFPEQKEVVGQQACLFNGSGGSTNDDGGLAGVDSVGEPDSQATFGVFVGCDGEPFGGICRIIPVDMPRGRSSGFVKTRRPGRVSVKGHGIPVVDKPQLILAHAVSGGVHAPGKVRIILDSIDIRGVEMDVHELGEAGHGLVQNELVVQIPGFRQAGGVMITEQKAQRPPAALAIPGRDGVAYQLVEAVAAQGGDSHGIFRLLGISDQTVPRCDPDSRNRPGFNHRRFNSLKEGEKVVFFSIEEHATQKSGEFPELFFVQRVEPVVAGNDESLAERHFQIKLGCVGGRYE